MGEAGVGGGVIEEYVEGGGQRASIWSWPGQTFPGENHAYGPTSTPASLDTENCSHHVPAAGPILG